MWTMARSAFSLFLRGRLFANPRTAYGRLAAGILFTALVCLILTVAGTPLWAAAMVAGFLGGGLQTYLLKTVKFR
jgi:predicted oxidoreductase